MRDRCSLSWPPLTEEIGLVDCFFLEKRNIIVVKVIMQAKEENGSTRLNKGCDLGHAWLLVAQAALHNDIKENAIRKKYRAINTYLLWLTAQQMNESQG